MPKKKQQHAYSHLNDDYWTTSAPAAVAAQPKTQPVLDQVNTAQGEQSEAPATVETG